MTARPTHHFERRSLIVFEEAVAGMGVALRDQA